MTDKKLLLLCQMIKQSDALLRVALVTVKDQGRDKLIELAFDALERVVAHRERRDAAAGKEE